MTDTALAPRSAAPSPQPDERAVRAALLTGSLAMVFVGASVAVSGMLADAPELTAQALRYAVASGILALAARVARIPVPRPRGADWLWLVGVSALGLVIFNLALVHGASHAEPAVFGVAVASVPVLLAVLGPVLEGQTPHRQVVLAAVVVTVGAALVQGFGRSDALGLVLAVVVLACEAGFTLLAVPVLRRLGAWGVSVHTTWIAAVVFAVLGVPLEGPVAIAELSVAHWAATAFLAVAVTAVAFVLWYSTVGTIGAGTAGLLCGVAPVSAVLTGALLGGQLPGPVVWLGIATVGLGLAVGLRPRR